MSTPTPTKLAAHLAKFRYETAAIPAIQSPKREPVDPAPAIVSPQIRRTPAKRKRDLKLEDEYVERSPSSPDGQTSTKVRKVKVNRPYASPETYAHLKAVPDLLRPGLKLVFCGINPSITSSTKQAPYSHPSNRFWKALHGAGFTDRLYDPQECIYLPERFGIGMTNLVSRPTAEQAELSSKEMRIGALDLLRKIQEHRPGIVCFVGKKIWDEFEFVLKRSAKPARKPWRDEAFRLGEEEVTASPSESTPSSKSSKKIQWDQPRPYRVAHKSPGEGFANTLFWVVPSTSGLVRVQLPEQIEHFKAALRMIDLMQTSTIDFEMFREVDIDGVVSTVATLSA